MGGEGAVEEGEHSRPRASRNEEAHDVVVDLEDGSHWHGNQWVKSVTGTGIAISGSSE